MGDIFDWLRANIVLVAALLTGAIAIWLVMPRLSPNRWSRALGAALGAVSILVGGFALIQPSGEMTRDLLFCLFSAIAIIGGVFTIANHNPVYAALSFALATLSVCGLFLLSSAPFLAAATVIVYAGAIVVTFLFVIMLAQQQGLAVYDRQAAQPIAAIVVAIVLLGGMLSIIRPQDRDREIANVAVNQTVLHAESETAVANPLSRSAKENMGSMRDLGRSMFGDYLLAVELAGTLLMVAAIGAIAIAPKRTRGTL